MRNWPTRKTSLTIVLSLSLPMLIANARADAQALYGSINGTITDSTGAVVPNAVVAVTDMGKGKTDTIKSNESGEYLVQHLLPDNYKVHVEAQGFSAAESTIIEVSADGSQKVDIQLKAGAGATTVEVTGDSPQLKTDRADVASVLNTRSIEDLPNLSRNATSFMALVPGATPSQFSNSLGENPQQSTPVAANGQSAFSVGFLLDGANNKDSFIGEVIVNPPLDSIAEMKFVTQDYDAEFGATASGLVIASTKSGSNSLHGSAFDYRHSDAQEARNPFTQYPGNNPLGPDVPPSIYNLFGGSVGGPILKNKLFYFGDYQGQRQKTGGSFFQTVPTALAHQTCGVAGVAMCDLSQYLAINDQVYDPATGDPSTGVGRTPFSGNLIPNSRLTVPGVNLLNLLPLPNNSNGLVNNYTSSGFGLFNTNQFDTRVDSQLTATTHVIGRYSYFGATSSSPGALGAAGGQGFFGSGFAGAANGRNQDLVGGADMALSAKLSTDFRVGYYRYHVLQNKYDGTEPLMTNLGLPGLNTDADGAGGAAGFTVTGLSSFGSSNSINHCNCPLHETEQEYDFVNNWIKLVGNHSFKLGADYRHLGQLRIDSGTSRTGELTFSNLLTADPTLGGGSGLATMLFGNASGFSRYVSSVDDAEEHQQRLFFYGQDSWRATPRLTINYGLRWEDYFPEAVNGKGKGGFYDVKTNLIRVSGYGNIGNNLNVSNTLTNFAPRIGIAYQAAPATVLRAGYGRSYDPGFFGDIFASVLTVSIPVLISQGLTSISAYTPVLSNPSDPTSYYNIAAAPPAPTFYNVPSNGLLPLPANIYPSTRPSVMRIPYVDAWNLTVQQQLASTVSLSIGYVANKATHTIPASTYGGYNWNDYTVVGYKEGLTPCRRSVFFAQNGSCGPGFIGYYGNEANAKYESLQVVLDKRFSSGLQFQSSYVWSNAEANSYFSGGYFQIDPRVTWGHFDTNRTNSFLLYGNYDLPFGRGKQFGGNAPRWIEPLIGGYQLNGDFNWASGLPYSLSLQTCVAEVDNGPCRPDRAGGAFVTKVHGLDTASHSVAFFTPLATPLTVPGQTGGVWRAPQPESFGNVGTNSYFGPGYVNADVSLSKSFAIREGLALHLQAQAFNAFNHANLQNPYACVDCSASSGAGTITGLLGTASMRQLQFAARIVF